MSGLPNMPVERAIRAFAPFGVEAAFVMITQTGLGKYYFDATAPVRALLRRHQVHNFDTQLQGQANKSLSSIDLIGTDRSTRREIALYRPVTKHGDPRIRITGINTYLSAGDVLAFIVGPDSKLSGVNVSNEGVLASRFTSGAPLQLLLGDSDESAIASELRVMLENVARQGPMRSLRRGDTGVGFTLESALGIAANSRRAPDYKGIEIKSGRAPRKGRTGNRSTLFSKTPDWAASPLNARQLLAEFGYPSETVGRTDLYCTVSALRPNPQSLTLVLPDKAQTIEVVSAPATGPRSTLVRWDLAVLEAALSAKHQETFWVSATTSIADDGVEEFHYLSVTHTRSPLLTNFLNLIELGRITLDITLSSTPGGATNDHGYLFKIWPADLPLLFPEPRVFKLT